MARPPLASLVLAGFLAAVWNPLTPLHGQTLAPRHEILPLAPEYMHEVWTIEDGLPVNEVTAVLQARDGYLWLATFDGLVRFDGARFTVFDIGSHPRLPSNRIVALHESRDGALWLLTERNRLARFHDGAFESFGPENGLRGLQTHVIHGDTTGTIWVGTDRDVSYYRDGRMTPLLPEPLERQVRALHCSRDGALWIGTLNDGLLRFQNGRLERVGDGALVGMSVQGFYEAGDGTIWVAARGGLFRHRDGVLEAVPDDGLHPLHFIAPYRDDDPLVVAEEGLFERNGERLDRLPLERWELSGRAPAIRDSAGVLWLAAGARLYRGTRLIWEAPGRNWIRGLAIDHEGSVWIAHIGLHRLKSTVFTGYGPEAGGIANVYSIHEDTDGTLWFASLRNGLARFAGGRFTVFTQREGLPGDAVGTVTRDRDGHLWIGTWGGGLCVFRPGRRCDRPGGEITLANRVVRAIHEDREGTFWVGTDDGLFRSTPANRELFAAAPGLSHRSVRLIREGDSAIWFGTYGGGLVRYRPESGFEAFTGDDGLSSDLIRSIYQDPDGVLWIGTEGRGLNRLEPDPDGELAGARLTVYRQEDGLYDEVVHQILEDDFGRVWMSSNRGIFWVTRTQLEAFARGAIDRIHSTHYTERDGLRNREANGGFNSAGLKARDGRLWFPTQAGVEVVDPARIRRNTASPPVVIEEVTADDELYSVVSGGGVQLGADQRDFAIAYTALSFVAPENVRFRYRLEGFEEDWVDGGNRRTAFYTNVPPGRYTFRVIASNNDGVWNETGATLPIGVARFFYETAWFRGLAALAVLGSVIGVVGLRLRIARRREAELVALVDQRTGALQEEKEASEQARREAERHSRTAEQALATVEAQAEKMKELAEAKARFFSNISHEFRTPLTLMIGPLEDLQAGLHGSVPSDADREISLALRNARRLLRLVDQLLDAARLEAKRIEVRAAPGDIVAFLRGLLLAFTPVIERKRIAVRFDEPERPCEVYFDPDLMEKAFANLLGNAFKYTPEAGTVRVSVRAVVPVAGHPDFVEMPEGLVRVQVKDSGPGIPAGDLPRLFERFYRAAVPGREQIGTGIGLSLARELVELHGGRIEVESEEGFGATFTVTLPLGNSHFDESQLASADTRAGHELAAPDRVREAVASEDLHADADDDVADRDAGAAAASAEDVDRPTVLVIDDSSELRAYVSKHLRGSGFQVVEAGSGADGLRRAAAIVPDCIISDIVMPGLDGHALCRAVRSDPELDFVPVILLTARAERDHRLEGLAEGADDYITKPFDAGELAARVQNLITSRHRLRERFRRPGELHPAPVDVSSSDEAFLERIRGVLEDNLTDSEFSVERLAHAVSQSRSQLYRRVHALLGQSPSEVIQQFRLERGADLLAAKAGTVSEIAYGVGFKSVSHFCRRFRSRYGLSPSEYAAAAGPPRPRA